MHVADKILKEVEDGKIADIFAEPEMTKVFLQLKELEMIRLTEERVVLTEEGNKALRMGIQSYFAQKRAASPTRPPQDPGGEEQDLLPVIPAASVTVPAA